MTTLNTNRKPRQPHLGSLRIVLAWICVVLILVMGSVHLLHQHPVGVLGEDASSAACGLCAVAHLSVLAAPVVQQPVVAQTFTSFDPQTIQVPPPRFFHHSLYVRPPPVLTHAA